MQTRNRFLISLGGTVLFLFLCLLLLTAAVRSAGTLTVRYDGSGKGADHISLQIPGIIVNGAMLCVPGSAFECHLDADVKPWIGLVDATIAELYKMPDAVLVDIETADENVLIRKDGHHLKINVKTEDEDVAVSVPLRTVQAALNKLGPGYL
ncbi:MAG: hypothetical protein GF355_13590 [Candidatus Eisenbacteria bacterium]|nr:hypothetical protein [Candidatus Eisenbacteria bacterium]